jgi:fluoride exporter
MERYLLVLAGAAVGGLARYVLSTAVMQRFPMRFPLGTLAVNVTGCFLIGVLMTVLTEKWNVNPAWRLLLVTGVLGGYTTYSSFAWETYQAVRDGSFLIGLMNVLLSVVLGYVAVWCGALLGSKT